MANDIPIQGVQNPTVEQAASDNQTVNQARMNGDALSIKAPKECSKKFAANLKGKSRTRGNILRLCFMFLEDFEVPL